jgi:hypothetical protein
MIRGHIHKTKLDLTQQNQKTECLLNSVNTF